MEGLIRDVRYAVLLSPAATRQQEMAVRTATGASRSRLIRQLLLQVECQGERDW